MSTDEDIGDVKAFVPHSLLKCGACGKQMETKALRCGKCKVQIYCGSECQKADWKLHKASCKTPTEQAERFNQGANACFTSGDIAAAIPLYTKAIEADPAVAKYYGNRSQAHLQLGHWDDAERDAQTALSKDPTSLKFRYRLTRAYMAMGDSEKARGSMVSLINRHGDAAEVQALKEEFLRMWPGANLKPQRIDRNYTLNDFPLEGGRLIGTRVLTIAYFSENVEGSVHHLFGEIVTDVACLAYYDLVLKMAPLVYDNRTDWGAVEAVATVSIGNGVLAVTAPDGKSIEAVRRKVMSVVKETHSAQPGSYAAIRLNMYHGVQDFFDKLRSNKPFVNDKSEESHLFRAAQMSIWTGVMLSLAESPYLTEDMDPMTLARFINDAMIMIRTRGLDCIESAVVRKRLTEEWKALMPKSISNIVNHHMAKVRQ